MRLSTREQRLRRTCRQLLRDLDVRPPLDIDALCARLGESRGRELQLLPRVLPVPGPFGLWIATPTTDVIVFQENTSFTHQDHIILHEVGHIVAGHGGEPDLAGRVEAVPELDDELALHALGRTCYDTGRERDAELIASIIGGDLGARPAGVEERGAADRVQNALTFHVGWWR